MSTLQSLPVAAGDAPGALLAWRVRVRATASAAAAVVAGPSIVHAISVRDLLPIQQV